MSAVHWDAIEATGLTRRFDRIFGSHQIGCMKPARAAFELALEGMRLRPSDVLFLDDGLRNVEVARALGIEAYVVKGPAEARAVLSTFGAIAAGVRA